MYSKTFLVNWPLQLTVGIIFYFSRRPYYLETEDNWKQDNVTLMTKSYHLSDHVQSDVMLGYFL